MADENAPQTEQKTLAERLAEERAVAEHEAAVARLRLERAKLEDERAKLYQSMPAEEAAAQEAALAKLKLERATLERDLEKLARPWWRSWNVTALGAFFAAMAPLTTGISAYFEKQKQLALEVQKQEHDIAMARRRQDEDIRVQYLDRLKDVESRERVLRFITATSSDPGMKVWANAEVKLVDTSKSKLEKDLADLQQKQADMVNGLEEQRKETQRRIDEIKAQLRPMVPARVELTLHDHAESAPRPLSELSRCNDFAVRSVRTDALCRADCFDDKACLDKCAASRAAAIAAGCYDKNF